MTGWYKAFHWPLQTKWTSEGLAHRRVCVCVCVLWRDQRIEPDLHEVRSQRQLKLFVISLYSLWPDLQLPCRCPRPPGSWWTSSCPLWTSCWTHFSPARQTTTTWIHTGRRAAAKRTPSCTRLRRMQWRTEDSRGEQRHTAKLAGANVNEGRNTRPLG